MVVVGRAPAVGAMVAVGCGRWWGRDAHRRRLGSRRLCEVGGGGGGGGTRAGGKGCGGREMWWMGIGDGRSGLCFFDMGMACGLFLFSSGLCNRAVGPYIEPTVTEYQNNILLIVLYI